jgi:hypothetical protein
MGTLVPPTPPPGTTLCLPTQKSKSCYNRRSSPHLGPKTRFFINVRELRVCSCGAPSLTRDESVVYNYCWPSPVQSYLQRSKSVHTSPIFTLLHVGILHIGPESGSFWTPVIYNRTCNSDTYNVYKAWQSTSCPNSCSSCYNGCLVTYTVICLTAAKSKSSQSYSYFTTGGLSPINSSWRQDP